ncbi:MAG TPA: aminotransferase class III-fold pyridoxal phosphate-dependent enzyme, partial [Gemmatirosa sp.]
MATLVRPGAPDVAPAPTATPAAPSATEHLLGTYKRAPMRLVRGDGVTLWDETGHAYLDFTSGIAVNALGYGDPGLAQAMRDATESGLVHVSNLFRTEPGERLAEFPVSHS